jgi:hypothetical protein
MLIGKLSMSCDDGCMQLAHRALLGEGCHSANGVTAGKSLKPYRSCVSIVRANAVKMLPESAERQHRSYSTRPPRPRRGCCPGAFFRLADNLHQFVSALEFPIDTFIIAELKYGHAWSVNISVDTPSARTALGRAAGMSPPRPRYLYKESHDPGNGRRRFYRC